MPPPSRKWMIAFLFAHSAAMQAADQVCAKCHPGEVSSQPRTPMANALLMPGLNATLEAHPRLSFTIGKFNYRVETILGATTYTVSDGERSITIPVTWTFGAGSQTYVLEREGQFYESMVSYYPATGGLDVTVGDEKLNPRNLDDAVGRKLESGVVTSCFGCHSTRSVANRKLDLHSMIPGVTCERCHAGAPQHLAAVSRPGKSAAIKAAVPEKLRARSAEGISDFCGQCHRSWETVVRNNWRGQSNVRFQPYRLANSRCFDGADRRISCIACHDPHQNLITSLSAYDAKCLACHSTRTLTAHANSSTVAKACPVADSGCATCHMPKVQLPGGHQTFTDHQIRIVRAGEAYPN